jgi:hypothetical protein
MITRRRHDLIVLRNSPATRVAALVSALVAAGAAVSTGCSTAATSANGGFATPGASASATPSPTPSGHPPGARVTANNGLVEATVFGYQQPTATGAAAPEQGGYVWGAVDAQACASATDLFNVTVSSTPWQLRYADGSQITPSKAADPQFPQPLYPSTQTSLAPGACVRGWIVFAVPANTDPMLIRYAPRDATPVDWAAG